LLKAFSAARALLFVVAKWLFAGLATATQSTAHGDAFLPFLIKNTQVAPELQWTILHGCHRDSLRSANRHPIRKLANGTAIKKLDVQMLIIAIGFVF